uniref:Uncharacterized protein n=1 Tax=Anguilla anguilla TaxID=7936 RepID=A0A0E9Q730_ANGAN
MAEARCLFKDKVVYGGLWVSCKEDQKCGQRL